MLQASWQFTNQSWSFMPGNFSYSLSTGLSPITRPTSLCTEKKISQGSAGSLLLLSLREPWIGAIVSTRLYKGIPEPALPTLLFPPIRVIHRHCLIRFPFRCALLREAAEIWCHHLQLSAGPSWLAGISTPPRSRWPSLSCPALPPATLTNLKP